ncbi:hypothetical protein ACFSTA_08880 [Ornithinibacillus salinisoli]|uniref:Uncharacterized protein n=1 Tax=Ornithinibacillus salinisoli TaxID=1848459 RepID=A0ABW4VZ16_9BACI
MSNSINSNFFNGIPAQTSNKSISNSSTLVKPDVLQLVNNHILLQKEKE